VELYVLSPYAFAAYSVKRSLHSIRKGDNFRLIEHRVQNRIFGSKREDVAREFWKFNIDVLHKIHSLPYIIGFNKSRNLRWMGCEAHRGVMKK
jgi:hypothetical protein